jgi:hypothetical protein
MRAKLVGLGVLLLVGGAPGCFDAVSELSEAEAVAEALTRGMRFNGGQVRDGTMPDTNAQDVVLLPPGLPTVMSPGQASLMSFDLDEPGEDEDPVDATLVQFEGSRKHISARPDTTHKSSEIPWRYEHSFEVDSDICDGLCNKQHAVKMRVALKLRDGRVSRSQTVNLTLDCRDEGDSSACDRPSGGGSGNIAGTEYLAACQNVAGICSGVAEDNGISSVVVECVALYQCVQVFFTGDSFCQDLLGSFVECMADADSASGCDTCSSISDELMDRCTYPETCLSGVSFDGLDASVGPEPVVDASRPDPVWDLFLTGSLVENCRQLCDLAQQQACPNFTDTCEQDCHGGLLGTQCEQSLVDLQRCAWDMSGQSFNCDDTGSPVFNSSGAAMCPGEAMKFSECLVNNPGFSLDAGPPADGEVDASVPDAGPP